MLQSHRGHTIRLAILVASTVFGTLAFAAADQEDAKKMVAKFRGDLHTNAVIVGQPVVTVTLSASRVQDANLSSLTALSELEKLELDQCPGIN